MTPPLAQTSMQAMLEELKALDPDTWWSIHDIIYIANLDLMHYDEYSDRAKSIIAYLIQGELMRANAARGLYGEVQWGPERAFARITKWWSDFADPEEIAMREAASPASAILAAYIQALGGSA